VILKLSKIYEGEVVYLGIHGVCKGVSGEIITGHKKPQGGITTDYLGK